MGGTDLVSSRKAHLQNRFAVAGSWCRGNNIYFWTSMGRGEEESWGSTAARSSKWGVRLPGAMLL